MATMNMTETMAALALCAAADWKATTSTEIFESCGLEFFSEPGCAPADLEIAKLPLADGIEERHALRWSAKGHLCINVIATSTADEVSILDLSISAAKEQF